MDNLHIHINNDETATHCSTCNEQIAPGSRFCKYCGAAQIQECYTSSSEEKWIAIKQLGLFFVIDAVICCIAGFTDFFKSFTWHVTIDILLASCAVFFFFYNWRSTRSLLNWKSFSITKLLFYCLSAILASFTVSFVVGWLNRALFSKVFSYYAFYEDLHHGKLIMISFIAVMPALFEEIGYRGFLLQKLLQVVDKKQAIFISAFLFAIMHTSFISLFWLIPFGLYLAYIRMKENTLWYGVCVHFCFNFTVCMSEFYRLEHLYRH
ncbi:MAG: CPBP family intramembrane metalloprotease [Mucilaginibacter sp.]|nr:CPBP family intramembrane metalloprotease [Mucilaginibacter sp.]